MESTEPASEPPPWGRERDDLDEDAVRSIVRARFDEVACHSVRKAGEGWDFDVWRVDDCAFRFPKKLRWSEQQQREVKLLEALAPRLPIAVPRPRWMGTAGDDFPYTFVGYPWLEGMGGDQRMPATARWAQFADQYGAFLHALHTTTKADLGAFEPTCGREPFVDRLEEMQIAIRAELSGPAFERAWAEALSFDHEWPYEPVLVHNDLCPEHWIIAEDGRLTGVIDWTDAVWGDPIGDLAGLWIWFGEGSLRRALASYGPCPASDVYERVRARGIGLVMIWIGEWIRWSSKDSINDRAAALIPRFLDLLPGVGP